MKGRIHSLESFGTVDGPGTRFVVFFQGCPMRCLYCHNPDSWELGGGIEMDTKEILDKADGVREFLHGGGITASGGEPLIQMEFLTELFRLAKEQYDFHTCLDTSGITFTEKKRPEFDTLIRYTNLVMLDIKHIDPDEHIKLTSQKQDNVIAFAKYLSEHDIPIWIRHVLVPGITQNDDYLYKLGRFIGTLRTLDAVEILPYHDMGKAKYEKLGMDYKLRDTPLPTKEDAETARETVMRGVADAQKEMNDHAEHGSRKSEMSDHAEHDDQKIKTD